MLKIILIGIKDLRIAFRDRAALILMLAAPFVLTLGMGFITGRFSGASSSGLSDIPVVVVNQDGEQLGNALAELLGSGDLAELLEVSASDDAATAHQLIDADQAAAAVVIPAGFTRSIIPAPGALPSSEPVKIEVYANPSRPTSSGVVTSIVDEFLSRVEEGRVIGATAVGQLLSSGRLAPDQIEVVGWQMGERLATQPNEGLSIRLERVSAGNAAVQFDVLAYMAPGMALLFLMFTVTYGGRSLLAERNQGTLPRLLISPTTNAQVLGGKVLGIFLTGAAQLFILIGASTLLFGLQWGDPLGVAVLVLAAVFGAAGWGLLITALARTPGQVASYGSAIMLTFGILGGSFINLDIMPPAVQWLSKLTPNAWGLNGFTTLALGGGLDSLGRPISALLVMGAALFVVAALLLNRRGIMQR